MKKDISKEDTPIFMKIHAPKEIERTILTTTMDVGGLVKRFESYQRLRNLRLEKTSQLQRSLGVVRKELSGFSRFLPKLKEEPIKKEESKSSIVLTSLDKELSDIERRLKEL